MALVNGPKENLPAIDETRVSLLGNDRSARHQILGNSVQHTVRWMHRNAHHQDLWLERSQVNANGKRKARADVIVWNADDMPSMPLNICEHFLVPLVIGLTKNKAGQFDLMVSHNVQFWANENKMSDGGPEDGSRGVKVSTSSQKRG
jgi:hypothetical protein